jgi:hypothetical protein
MNIRSPRTVFITALVALLGIAGTRLALSAGPDGTLYEMSDYLPVSADGYRYTSIPYGELAGILKVVHEIKAQGGMQRISSRGMKIPSKSDNRIVARYDYTFPASCGGNSFTYYEGDSFAALGYVHEGTVILDVLEGGGPYTAPRLWGPYDQVLDNKTPMVTVASFNGENGSGLMNASFLAGRVTGLEQAMQESLGTAYSSAIYTASRCTQTPGPGKLVVTK